MDPVTEWDVFLLTCLLRGMTSPVGLAGEILPVSTHMPLARHDLATVNQLQKSVDVSTHMPLARHDPVPRTARNIMPVSTHMPLARHDDCCCYGCGCGCGFYSHASCEA